jgi:hypothetical protein
MHRISRHRQAHMGTLCVWKSGSPGSRGKRGKKELLDCKRNYRLCIKGENEMLESDMLCTSWHKTLPS